LRTAIWFIGGHRRPIGAPSPNAKRCRPNRRGKRFPELDTWRRISPRAGQTARIRRFRGGQAELHFKEPFVEPQVDNAEIASLQANGIAGCAAGATVNPETTMPPQDGQLPLISSGERCRRAAADANRSVPANFDVHKSHVWLAAATQACVKGRGWKFLFGGREGPKFMNIARLVTIALALCATQARADPIADCNDMSNPARQIRGCTQVIAKTMMSEPLSVAYMNRGIAYAERQQRTKALADFSAAVKANGSNGVAYYNRGNVYFDLRKLREAAADYSKAIELESDMAPAFLNRGLVNELLGERDASISDYRAALKLDPTLSLASDGLNRLDATPVEKSSAHEPANPKQETN
jgi:hypothetical protein